MQLDPRTLVVAGEALASAASHAATALDTDVPRLLGRGRALHTIQQSLDSAIGDADRASTLLAGVDGPLRQAREAADQLATAARSFDVHERSFSRGSQLRTAGSTARVAASELTTSGHLLAAPASSLRSSLLDIVTARTIDRGAQRAVVTVSTARADELGDVAPFLAATGGPRNDSILLAQLLAKGGDGPLDVAGAWNGLLMVARDTPLPASSMRQAFTTAARDAGVDAAERMPAWLAGLADDAPVTLTPARRHELSLLSTAHTSEDVVDALVARLAERPQRSDLDLVRVARDLPHGLAVELPLPAGSRSIEEMMSGNGAHFGGADVDSVRDAWLALVRSSDSRKARVLEEFAQAHPSYEKTVRRARLVGDDHELLIGQDAAKLPWARALVDMARDGQLNGRHQELSRTWELLRRTGGDRVAIVNELAALVASKGAVDTPEALRAAAAIQMLPTGVRPTGLEHIDTFVRGAFDRLDTDHGRSRTVVARMLDVVLDAERVAMLVGDDAALVERELGELLSRPPADLTRDDWRGVAVLATTPVARQLDLGSPARLLRGFGLEDFDDVPRAVDELRVAFEARQLAAHSDFSPADAAAELRRLIALPTTELTTDIARRIQLLQSIPDVAVGAGPAVLRAGDGTLARIATGADWHASIQQLDDLIRHERDSVLFALDRGDLVRAGATPETVVGELRELLAVPTEQLSAEQVRRLAVLDGMPEHLRPVRADLPEAATLARSWRPGHTGAEQSARERIELLRVALEAADDAARTGATAEQHARELANLLFRPRPFAPTEAELRRIAQLSSMPRDVRPPVPPPQGATVNSLSASAISGRLAEDTFELARARAAVIDVLDDPVGSIVGVSRDAGTKLDVAKISSMLSTRLFEATDAELSRHGIDRFEVLASALSPTRDSGDPQAIARATRYAREVLAGLDEASIDDSMRPVLTQLRELLDRNSRRFAGTLDDGFLRHPDYAEHGRAVAAADLLATAGRATPEPPTAPASTLAW